MLVCLLNYILYRLCDYHTLRNKGIGPGFSGLVYFRQRNFGEEMEAIIDNIGSNKKSST
jgi:hypothetical protein